MIQETQLDGELLTVPEVAAMLGIQRERAYNMVRDGEIPAIRLSPRRIRVRKSALNEWLASRESAAKAG